MPAGQKISPALLRVTYSELTLDASVEQNRAIEASIREAIIPEDPDLVTDLRHINPGRPSDTFAVFFDKLSEKVEEMTAAVEHFSKFVSVRDLINNVQTERLTKKNSK